MTANRLGHLARVAGALVGALLGACFLGTASSSSADVWTPRMFGAADDVQDKVLTGDSVLTFPDVSYIQCAVRCMKELLCAFFFYQAAQRTCAVPTSVSRAGTVLQDAPGYRLFAVSPGSAVVAPSSSDIRLCPAGAVTGARGCWKQIVASLSHVSVGPAGVWGFYEGWLYTRLQTYGNPGTEGTSWLGYPYPVPVQADVGTDVTWLVKTSSEVVYRSGMTSALTGGGAWVVAAASGYRWVSASPQGATWAVGTDGDLRLGLTAAPAAAGKGGWGPAAGNVSTVGAAGMGLRRVDAGAAGVWALDSAGRLLHRLGTYGQDGVEGTGWRQVGSGVFRSVSSGRDLAVAVDSAGHVWLSAASDPSDAPTGLGWVWLGGGLAQAELYQSGDVTVMWATTDQSEVFFFIL